MTISYDEWIRVMVAVKAATSGSEEGFAAFDAWSARSSRYDAEVTRQKWDSFRPPYAIGFPYLAQLADEHSGGKFNRARFDFDAVDVGHCRAEGEAAGEVLGEAGQAAGLSELPSFLYREPTREWVRTRDGAIMKVETFNDCREGQRATAVDLERRVAAWMRDPERKEKDRPRPIGAHNLMKGDAAMVQTLTYMPGRPKLLAGKHPGDLVFNIYNPPARPFAGQAPSPAEEALLVELFEQVLPDEQERTIFLDWVTFIAQNPGKKVHWAPLLFSKTQGVGKDTLLKILRYGVVGASNMQSIEPARLEKEFNDDWACKQVVLVPEVPSFHKRDLYDKLKDLVGSGAGSLSVNPKGLARYEVPNAHCWVFTSNKADALQLDTQDRRFVILHAAEERLPTSLRDRVSAFMDWNDDDQTGSARGYHLAGEWLRRRRLGAGFDRYECRILTSAKETMLIETLPSGPRDAYEAITAGTWAKRTVVGLAEVMQAFPCSGREYATRDAYRRALEMAGCALPKRRDNRNRVSINTLKVEVWLVRSAKELDESGLRTAREIGGKWSEELADHDFAMAGRVRKALETTCLTLIEGGVGGNSDE